MRFSRYISLFASIVFAPAVWAQGAEQILDHGGQLQRVLTGSYAELFGNDGEIDGATPVLTLDSTAPTGEITRILVPGTEDARIETTPRLFQDPKADNFVLLWHSQDAEGATRLDFATYDGTAWSDVVTLERDGAAVSPSGVLKMVQTHDAFELDLEDGSWIQAARMVVHLLWQDGESPRHTYYAPLTFIEGRYLGWHGVFELNDMFLHSSEGDSEAAELTTALSRSFELQVSGNGRSVMVTFANPLSHRVGSLEISPMPLEFGLLGEQVRERVFELADLYNPDDLTSFSEGMRAAIIIIGQRFHLHDAHGDYVADQIADWILNSGGDYGWEGLENLGNDVRGLSIDAAREVSVSSSADSADPDSDILRIDVSDLFGDPDPSSLQIFDFRTLRDLPAPAIDEGLTGIFTSRRGDELLIGWLNADGTRVHWVESRGGGGGYFWSEVFTLPLGGEVTVEAARQLLIKKAQ